MDVNFMKQLAKRLLAYLQPQLGPAFKLGHAQDLIAALSGLRRWPEVQAFPDKVAGTELTLETVHRLCRRIEERFKTQVAAKHFERGPRSSIPDLDEFVDFIRRVQIPYARVRFKHPQVREDFRDSGEFLPYRPETLKRISEDPDYES
jgi:hypothetical protein